MTTYRTLIVAVVSALLVVARTGAAQQVPGGELTQVLVTRQALEDLATRLEQTAESRSASGEQRARARTQAAAVRRRLSEGDFQIGDRIMLRVEGETALTDTFTVETGPQLRLPQIGTLSLAGVLRVELLERVTPFIARFVRDPRIQAKALIRIAVLGGVTRQGFYTVPVDMLVTDVLTGPAAGFGATSLIDKTTIVRDHDVLYDADAVQRAITEGRTLDALSIRAGDRIIVPERLPQNRFQLVQTISMLVQLPLTIFGVIKLFK